MMNLKFPQIPCCFSNAPLFEALEPGCRILVCMWPFGPLRMVSRSLSLPGQVAQDAAVCGCVYKLGVPVVGALIVLLVGVYVRGLDFLRLLYELRARLLSIVGPYEGCTVKVYMETIFWALRT